MHTRSGPQRRSLVSGAVAGDGAGLPPDRLSRQLTTTDIERAVYNYLEPGAGAELEHPYAPFDAFAERDQSHSGHLLQPAHPA